MAENKTTGESTVEQVDINLDELFAAAPDADAITLPKEEKKTKNIFSKKEKESLDFLDKEEEEVKEEVEEKAEEGKETEAATEPETKEEEPKKEETNVDEVLDSLDEVDEEEEEKKETRGRKKIKGISDVFTKLIKDEKIVPFDDDKSLEDYTAKDWEEFIEANLEEKASQVRKETPAKFFESLPEELKIAARYVYDGGQDLKGLFSTLAQTEETKSIDIKSERGQERIIQEYLSATGYGTAEEIAEEIEVWKDLGKLEQQASKFKPKLDKMQEKIVQQKLKRAGNEEEATRTSI